MRRDSCLTGRSLGESGCSRMSDEEEARAGARGDLIEDANAGESGRFLDQRSRHLLTRTRSIVEHLHSHSDDRERDNFEKSIFRASRL